MVQKLSYVTYLVLWNCLHIINIVFFSIHVYACKSSYFGDDQPHLGGGSNRGTNTVSLWTSWRIQCKWLLLKNVKFNNLDIKSEPYFIYNNNLLTVIDVIFGILDLPHPQDLEMTKYLKNSGTLTPKPYNIYSCLLCRGESNSL